jgi:hypothetical protein
MKKGLLTLFTLICFAGIMHGQSSYNSAIGLRFGAPISVSYKKFISDKGAIEGFVGFRGYSGYSWINLGAMYEHHMPISEVPGLQWYFGGGAGLYFYNYNDDIYDDESNFSVSIMGCLGLDYAFESTPINLSLDWTPAIFLTGYDQGFGAGYGALSARYILNR